MKRGIAATRWAAVALVATAGVLWRFPPDRYGFYPRCPFFEAFGLLCPGCGATRALAALLHGHPVEAWRSNALLVTALCMLSLYALTRHSRRRWSRPPAWAMAAGAVVLLVFGVARNL